MKKEGLFLFGMVIIIMGASFGILKIAGIVRCSEVTTATIVDVVEKNKSSKKSTSKYYPTVEFTVGDETIKGTADVGSRSSSEYVAGETLTVKYNPDKPAEFLLDSSANYAGLAGAAAVIIAGIVVVVLGLGIARRSEGVPVFRA